MAAQCQCETEMVLGCTGSLQAAYYRDNRLGTIDGCDIDHEELASAVAALPEAFDAGAGSKRIWLKVAFPVAVVGFIVVIIGAIASSSGGSSSSSSADCPGMNDPGYWDCQEKKHDDNASGASQAWIVTIVLMVVWFATCAVLMFLRSQAVRDGFNGVQQQLGKLNESMYPLNFSMRTEVTAVRERKPGHIGEVSTGTDRIGPGGTHRTRIIYRYFLEITNTSAQIPVIAQAQVVGVHC